MVSVTGIAEARVPNMNIAQLPLVCPVTSVAIASNPETPTPLGEPQVAPTVRWTVEALGKLRPATVIAHDLPT
jgi:hypothetical protein